MIRHPYPLIASVIKAERHPNKIQTLENLRSGFKLLLKGINGKEIRMLMNILAFSYGCAILLRPGSSRKNLELQTLLPNSDLNQITVLIPTRNEAPRHWQDPRCPASLRQRVTGDPD